MIGYRDFIVHVPEKFSETFTTESGVKLYGSKSFSKKRMANNIVEVIQVPLNNKTDVIVGDMVFVDPTLFMEQTYSKGGEQENIYLMNKKKGLFRLPESLIICHKPKVGEWVPFGKNVLLERIEEDVEEIKSTLILAPSKPKNVKGIAKSIMEVPELGIEQGDEVYIMELHVNDIWFGNKPVIWLRHRDLLGVKLNKAV